MIGDLDSLPDDELIYAVLGYVFQSVGTDHAH
jgi:hypothetical protein